MKEKVVIVDDSLIARMQLKKFFEEVMEYEVAATGKDGNEAVELFQKHQPDLMTMDLTMPNKNGLEALEDIMSLDEDARVIICSAIKESAEVLESLNAGARSYIEKPLELHDEDFVESIKDAIAQALE